MPPIATQNPDILAGRNDPSAGSTACTIQNPDISAGTHDPSAGTEEISASNSRAPTEEQYVFRKGEEDQQASALNNQASYGATISGVSPKQEPASQIREPDVFCVGVITKQKSGSRIEERYVDTSPAHQTHKDRKLRSAQLTPPRSIKLTQDRKLRSALQTPPRSIKLTQDRELRSALLTPPRSIGGQYISTYRSKVQVHSLRHSGTQKSQIGVPLQPSEMQQGKDHNIWPLPSNRPNNQAPLPSKSTAIIQSNLLNGFCRADIPFQVCEGE